MEKVDLKVIYDIIRPCGLAPKKSKAIQDLSKILVDKFDGIVPKDINELEKLPGVGHKTASVVISQGFGLPAFPVDTHIHRLAQRWGLTKGKNVKETEKDLKNLFPSEKWNKLHLQIIFYGREFCSAWSCDGTICEICTTCYPNRKKPFEAKKN
jgi:endonuclease-3